MRTSMLIFVMLSAPLFAQENVAISKLASCSDPLELSKLNRVLFKAVHNDMDAAKQYDAAIAVARQCSDDALKDAVAAAGKSQDLKTAIKDLYVKGNGYIDRVGRPGEDMAQKERAEALTRVKMEAKLAGM